MSHVSLPSLYEQNLAFTYIAKDTFFTFYFLSMNMNKEGSADQHQICVSQIFLYHNMHGIFSMF
jgi:hypothetical protein